MKNVFLIATLLTFANTLFAQEYITINGKVSDAQTGEALAYAGIGIQNAPIGTITNDEGEFTFHIPIKYKNDTLVISMLGYQNYKQQVSKCPAELNVKLTMQTYDLEEVTVSATLPFEIVKKAMDNMPNYIPTDPFIVDAYYHEYVQEDTTFVRAIEAATSIYTENDGNFQIRVNEIKRSKDFIENKKGIYPVILYLFDQEFYLYKSMFHYKKKDQIKYQIQGIFKWNDDKVYKISYSDDYGKYVYYISEKSNAIIKYNSITLERKIKDIKTVSKQKEFVIEYYWVGNYLYPRYKYIKFTDYVYKTKKLKQIENKFTYYAEFSINNIITKNATKFSDTENVMIPGITSTNIFDIKLKYNSVFWQNYNYRNIGSLKSKINVDLEYLEK